MKDYYYKKKYSECSRHEKYKDDKYYDCHEKRKGNDSIVNINIDKCESKCHEESKECCECSAIVNDVFSATTRFLINVCPDCEKNVSSILDQIGLTFIFSSTYIGPPRCYSAPFGTVLAINGTATFLFQGAVYEGVFSIFIVEQPGPTDEVIRIFSGVNGAGAGINIFGRIPVPDARLSIRSCNIHNNFNGLSNPLSIPNLDISSSEDKYFDKCIIFHPDGTTEEHDIQRG